MSNHRVINHKDETDRASGTCGNRRGARRVVLGNLKERDHLENQSVDGRIIYKYSGSVMGI